MIPTFIPLSLILLLLYLPLLPAHRLNAAGPALPQLSYLPDDPYITSPRPRFSRIASALSYPAPSGLSPLFYTQRWSPDPHLNYTIPVPPGKYTVTLHFAESQYRNRNRRLLDLRINGILRRQKLDIFSDSGFRAPLTLSIRDIPAVNSSILIDIHATKGLPILSGLAIDGPDALKFSKGKYSRPDPKCTRGISAFSTLAQRPVCCPAACKKCGGTGCATFQPPFLCCTHYVARTETPCSAGGAPCVMDCPETGAAPNSFSMNVGDGSIEKAGMGGDNSHYLGTSNKGFIFRINEKKVTPHVPRADFKKAYASHRWTTAPALIYRIPVNRGIYSVSLLFAETFYNSPNSRVFDVYINGLLRRAGVDPFVLAGKNTGLLLSFSNVETRSLQFISITIARVIGRPMLSGIIIKGRGAGSRAVGDNCVGAQPQSGDQNGGFDHRAHAVTGGPYSVVDTESEGQAPIMLDARSSHSHFQIAGPPPVSGAILSYKWTWAYFSEGAQRRFAEYETAPRLRTLFPLGSTTLTLTVVDSTGDLAQDVTTVEVKPGLDIGAYCYLYNFGLRSSTIPALSANLKSDVKPVYGAPYSPSINFNSEKSFGDVPFVFRAFAVQCLFYIVVPFPGQYRFTVTHSAGMRMYQDGALIGSGMGVGKTVVVTKLRRGRNVMQLQLVSHGSTTPRLKLARGNGEIVDKNALQYDSSMVYPVISSISKTESAISGGGIVLVRGSGFIRVPKVYFGDVRAEIVGSVRPGLIQVKVPMSKVGGSVDVTVKTKSGGSNGVKFMYTTLTPLLQAVQFETKKLMEKDGSVAQVTLAAAVVYGPDGRLYFGSTASEVFAMRISKKYTVLSRCGMYVGPQRAVLGVMFNPFSNRLRLYFTSSTLYWQARGLLEFENGWNNGKVESVDFSKTKDTGEGCVKNQQEIVTGLPVSNHDHSVNKLIFSTGGRLLIGVGGFTNGGVSIPGMKSETLSETDKLGGVASNPLSAAIVSCPWDRKTAIKYDNYTHPVKAKVVSGGNCNLYATGLRNSFGLILHSNGRIYATDNGANPGFGDFSTNCMGASKPAVKVDDKLFRIEKGKWHGHANLNRKQCRGYTKAAVKPILSGLTSSTSGIVEYRSNIFGGQLKGSLLLTRFAGQFRGQVSRVVLGKSGKVRGKNGLVESFYEESGLSVAEGGRGELIMPRVYQKEVLVLVPKLQTPSVTFVVGVIPRQGPWFGGGRVSVFGYNFGKAPKVTIGGKVCKQVVAVDDGRLTCVVPPGAHNVQARVVVTGSTGMSPSYGPDYWYF